MSWDPTFVARLVDPTDRGEAIRSARQLARACHMERCRMRSTDAGLVAAIAGARPMRLEVLAEPLLSPVLPPVLLRGAANAVKLQVWSAAPRPHLYLERARGASGQRTTSFQIAGAPRDVVEPYA